MYEQACSEETARNGCCGELPVAESAPEACFGPFWYQTRYSGHQKSRLSRGRANTTKQMGLPTTWEANTKQKKSEVNGVVTNPLKSDFAKLVKLSNGDRRRAHQT